MRIRVATHLLTRNPFNVTIDISFPSGWGKEYEWVRVGGTLEGGITARLFKSSPISAPSGLSEDGDPPRGYLQRMCSRNHDSGIRYFSIGMGKISTQNKKLVNSFYVEAVFSDDVLVIPRIILDDHNLRPVPDPKRPNYKSAPDVPATVPRVSGLIPGMREAVDMINGIIRSGDAVVHVNDDGTIRVLAEFK